VHISQAWDYAPFAWRQDLSDKLPGPSPQSGRLGGPSSPPHAHVKVAVARQQSRIRLTVSDSGPGMNEQDMRRIGERFFRVIGSEQGGSGLGWSIVRRIASAHQAELRIGRSSILGGLDVVIEWPDRQASTPE
jgi:two-component system sensor histidine kinase QseC